MLELEYLLRVIVAGICGALIGYERKNRMKEAGIRTHFVVAVGAALMVVISKYGFRDQIGWESLAFDPSRIAAQVVSGVGFLGAGMIFMQKQTVRGLTTAAGIWTTAGIGMAMGAGLYEVGGGVTLLVLVAQKLLHGKHKWLSAPKTETLAMRIANEPSAVEQLLRVLGEKGISVLGYHVEQTGGAGSVLQVEMNLKFSGNMRAEQLMPIIQQYPFIQSVEASS
ncbi:MgtC/SapB family protein [Paenibacillus hemerocallicola]|jgi:putative Mg2+ transporter-C (MgtC) family protein|uniref:MgtC/SapB family protein n=1 Tax=Paenibacillus hemerocallicola TaxID=1172614 RepID=A0A5C4SYT0_9BACL|nr:MgtC/SapB family protein [Paenibacillus hemerocallicola]TNJ61902.1 MgtC/SapB family protein [Paenibacillus hemerocallicola]